MSRPRPTARLTGFGIPSWALLAVAAAACSSSSSPTDGGTSTTAYDHSIPNSCLTAGTGFVCQARVCGGGFVNMQDYFCGSTGDFCCAPVGDGGAYDATNDANVFVDGATFDSGRHDATVVDAAHGDAAHADAGHDAGHDSGHDAGHDAGRDAEHDAGHPDAEHDAHAG